MKVSLSWLKELVEYNLSAQDLAEKLSLTSIGVKQYTSDYLELDLTYNRGDLLSLRGIARELAAVTGSKLLFSALKLSEHKLPETVVEITDKKFSPIQCVGKIEGLSVGLSNPEWVKKLADCAVRSVNNLVDVTNLIMLEFGQPLHAFAADTVEDETIIVRTASSGEEIVTLDNKLRKLSPQDIVLADTQGPVDVAGIMGGKDTEVKESTSTILLSASMFNPIMVRNTSKRLGLSSEASKRFQHGLTKTNLLQAFAKAIKMYEGLGGKLTTLSVVGDLEDPIKKVMLTQKKLNSLIGVEIKPEEVERYLQKLGFRIIPLRSVPKGYTLQSWEVIVPYWRLDIEIEEDLIEEVARMYGYEKINSLPLVDETPIEIDQSFYNFIYDLKVALKNTGLTEVQTYSFYSTNVLNALYQLDTSLGDEPTSDVSSKLVKIANPISSETEYLRQNIWPNLVEVVGRNLRKGFKDIAIFEIGKAFNNIKDEPQEEYKLAIALCNGTDNPLEELYQIAQKLASHIRSGNVVQTNPPQVAAHLFHPKRFVAFEKEDKQIGSLSEVHLRVLNKLGIEKRVAVLEIDITEPR